MLKAKGKNQTMVREINRRLVLGILGRGAASVTDIARDLRLSNTAVTKIITELKEIGLVALAEPSSAPPAEEQMGRKPILYEIAKDRLMTGVVNLAENSVMLVDITGNIIERKQSESASVFTGKMLMNLIEELAALKEKYADVKLTALCVITFGLLDWATGEYVFANRFENFKGINLVGLFKKRFGVPVHVINDTKISLIAEQQAGLLQRATNAVLMHVDTGVATALLLNGVNYVGEQGFAGEAGLITLSGKETLEECSSVTHIEREVAAAIAAGKPCSLRPGEATIEKIAGAFKTGDETVCGIVGRSASALGRVIRNIIHLLDAQVVICGRVVLLGEKYLKIVQDELKASAYITHKVQFSEIPFSEAARTGACKYACEIGFETLFGKK